MLLEDDYHLGLRDVATRIDLTTLCVQASYSQANFTANLLLPEDDPLVMERGNSSVAAFSDAGPTAVPAGVEVARALVGGKLVMTRAGAPAHRGAQVVSSPVQGALHMAEVSLRPVTLTAGAEAYIADADYQGACAGFVHGPTKKGIFVFLMDDGVTKSLLVSPADDGSGTRPGSSSVVYDWSLGVAIKTVWDLLLDKVDVYLRDVDDPDAVATKAYSATLSTEPSFISGVALDQVPLGSAADAPQQIYALVNLDSATPGDEIQCDFIRSFGFGKLLIEGGLPRPGVHLYLRPSDIVEADFSALPDKADLPWRTSLQSGDVAMVQVAGGLRLDKLSGTANGGLPGYLVREEPSLDLAEGFWLEMELLASDVAHLAVEATGIGVEIFDGADALLVALLDDYAIKRVGVLQAGGAHLGTSYATGAEVDWEVPVTVRLWANPDLDRVDLFIGDDDTPYATGTLSALPADVTSGQIRIGHVYSYAGRDVFGKTELRRLLYSTNARGFDAVEGAVPDAASLAWTRVSPGPGADAIVGAELKIQDDGYGAGTEVRYFWRTVPSFSALLGMSVEARFRVSSFTNDLGGVGALNTPVSAGVALDDGAEAAQLRFVATAGGQFAYLPGADPAASLLEVINQTDAGKAISTEVSFLSTHTYRLEKKPRQALRLFVDGVQKISIPWDEVDLAPTLFGAGVGFGSFDGDRASTSYWRRVVYAVGDGYDVAVRPEVPALEQEFVFDSLSELVVQVDGI